MQICFLHLISLCFPSTEVVYIGTLQINHLATGKLFMTQKKSVLIEKPLAMNSREVQDFISVFLMEVINSRLSFILISIVLVADEKCPQKSEPVVGILK